MKNIFKISLSLMLFISFSLNSFSQFIGNQSSNKNDSIECLKNISVYKEFQKLNVTDKAIEAWKKAYKCCNGSKKIIFQDGVKFLKYSIENEKNIDTKKILVDSLMNIYDQRIKYFNEKDFLLGKKGVDLLRYNPKKLEEARNLLNQSKELRANETELIVLVSLMSSTEILYKKNILSKTDVINTYLSVIDIINFQKNDVKEKKALHNIAIATNTIDEIFSKSNAADCEGIVAVFENKFINDSNNIDLILKIQSLLKGANCINSDLYFNTAYKLNILRPNAENAYILAGISIKREKHEDAVTFLKNAIELEKVDSIKSKYCLDLSIHYYTNLKQYQIARNYAYQAIELNKNWGKPYITIGDIYTSANNCGTNDFEKSAVLWAAVDKYNKAKEIEPDLTEFANKKIEYYKRFFPINSDAFFYGYTDGNPYKINCWINETTIVRTRK